MAKKKHQLGKGNNADTPAVNAEVKPTGEVAPELKAEANPEDVALEANNADTPEVKDDGNSAEGSVEQPQEPTEDDQTPVESEDTAPTDTDSDESEQDEVVVDHDSYDIKTVTDALDLLEGEDIPFADKIIILRNSNLEEIRQYIAVFIDYAKNMNGKPVEGVNNNYFLEKAIMRAFKHDDLEVSNVMLNIQEGYFKDTETNPAFKIDMLTRLSEKSKLSESKITQLHMLYMALTKLAAGERDVFVDAIADEEIVSKLKTFYNL